MTNKTQHVLAALLESDDEEATLKAIGYKSAKSVMSLQMTDDAFRETMSRWLNQRLATTAARQLNTFMKKKAKAEAVTPDEKRYADVLLGVLDRAGYAPYRAKEKAEDLGVLDVKDLAALRERVTSLLADRAKAVNAPDNAPIIEGNPPLPPGFLD